MPQRLQIWIDGEDELLYVGEARNLRARLSSHAREATHLKTRILFSFAKRPKLDKANLREVECDLIGAHFKAFKKPPINQFKQDIFRNLLHPDSKKLTDNLNR